MPHRRPIAFPFTAVLAALMLLTYVSPAPAAPEGTMTIGVHVTLVSRWLDPFIWGVGKRVAEPGAGLIEGYPYVGPAEDLRLR